MILLVAPENDGHVQHVSNVLNHRGVPTRTLDGGTFHHESAVSFTMRSHEAPQVVIREDLSDIHAVWYRRPRLPAAPRETAEPFRDFAAAEAKTTLYGIWQYLTFAKWYNPFISAEQAENKPYQLQKAVEVGLAIPPTLITTSAEAARRFLEEHGDVIYKPFAFHPTYYEDAGLHGIYTNRITINSLGDGSAIKQTPCLFQKYIPKHLEYRVTIIGETMFTCELDTQRSQRSALDWRRYDFNNVTYKASALPFDIEQKLFGLMHALGLRFGCADLILTPEGDYVFLEINQAGQWLWLEKRTNLPITQAFVDLLLS